QLKQIQKLARDKKDEKLSDALEKLSRVVTSLDDNTAASAHAADVPEANKPTAEPSALLLALLQEIQFKEDQREDLKSICGDLIRLLGSCKNQAAVQPQILKLASLINTNFDHDSSDPTTKADTPALTTNVSISEVLGTLLEKLTVIPCTEESIKLLRDDSLGKIDEANWQEVLNQIVSCITESLDKLNHEKYDLEEFIVKVTEQLVTISNLVAADQRDQQFDQDDRHSLQQMMLDSMKSIEDDFDSASEIDQLKSVVTQNLQQIQSGIEGFVSRANERHERIDERNSHLVAQIAAMDEKTRTLKKKLDENRE
ncbi:MAG: hypothetical protein GY784_08335, partial [Gammaproteobacteria bacterium]|nr:hypothetical protein [Gammaproteobacteria bacterium]